LSKSEAFDTRDAALDWVIRMERAASHGVDPNTATTTLSDYGHANMTLALRGLEVKLLIRTWPTGINGSFRPSVTFL